MTKRAKMKRTFDMTKYAQRHVALHVGYFGNNYRGLAVQPHQGDSDTIEDHLFSALKKSCLITSRATAKYDRCGRTDKGVSANSQVISITLRSALPKATEELNYPRILNRLLPPDIFVFGWASCPDEKFSARFEASGRLYRYFFQGDYNIDLMREAANHLVGEHDFRNFCKMDVENVRNFRREITRISFHEVKYGIWYADIEGNAFLWHQIRFIMSCLFLVGKELENPNVVRQLLNVTDHPGKPEYDPASELPLVLEDSKYRALHFHYDPDVIFALRNRLISKRNRLLIELAKTDNTLAKLDSFQSAQTVRQTSAQYEPLMKRQKCKSYEEKVESLSEMKRRKIMEVHGWKL